MIKRRMNWYGLLFFCLCHLSSTGQTDSLEGEAWLKRSETEFQAKDYRKALYSVEQAIALFRKSEALDRWLLSQRHKAVILVPMQGQPFSALSYMDSCLTLLSNWRMPAKKEEYRRYCRFLLMQSYIAKQYAEDFVLVKSALEKAYHIFLGELEEDTAIAQYLFFQLGNAYVRLGEFESAAQIFQAGHAYSLKFNAPGVAKFNDHAGLYIILKEYDEAKRIFLEGLSTKGLPEEDQIFTKLGYVEYLIKTADLEGATRINREIEAQLDAPLESSASKLPEFRRELFQNYGQISAAQGDCETALNWYQKALQTEQQYEAGSRRNVAILFNEIGNLYRSCNQPETALQAFQNALKTMIPGFDAPVGQNPDPSGFTAENTIYKALHGKAQCFEETGRPDLALECYELIPLVEAKLRATHEYESSTLQALEDSRARLDKAVGLAWQLYETTRDQRLAERAFNLTEQIRGVILLESLARDRNDRQLPDSIQQRQTGIQWKIAWFEREIAEAKLDSTGQEKVASLESGLFQAKQELEALKQSIPGHARLEENFTYRKAGEVPALLRPGALLLSYYFADAALYVFSCTPRRFVGWRKVAVTPEWQETTDAFAQFLTRLDESPEKKRWFLKTAAALYDTLLAPELAGQTEDIRSLVVIPDDQLSYLPFEVLLTGAASNGPWATFPYLVNRYSVAYNYSATLLSVQQSIEHAAAKSFFAAFTPVYAGDAADPVSGYRLDNLKKIQEASAAAARKFGGDVFVQDANEDLFKRQAFDYTILVLGMHGFAELDDPALSRLLIGNPQPRQEPDNVLYTAELRIMRLRARLVVLLACHTGYGQWRKGEGVYSLARAFTMASVPATVMSLWSLPDDSASPLMEVFFDKISRGGGAIDLALQDAKRAYLNNPEYFDFAHPFFWAGLMATGHAGVGISR